jgi:hypothetical protein
MSEPPRVPRDQSRPFLFVIEQLDDPQDERLSVCPVCGMSDPGNLDGEVRGWPAHRTCAEWLGDWKPEWPASAALRPMRPRTQGFEIA